MNKFLLPVILTAGLFVLFSCAQQSTVKPDEMDKLKADNQGLKDQMGSKDKEIDALNEKIMSMSAEISNNMQAKNEQLMEYSNLVKSLQEQLQSNQTSVSQTENTVSVTLVSDVFFDEGSDVIKPEGKKVLDKVAVDLKSLKDRFIRIEGYTDDVPINPSYQWKFPSNWELSTARADAVLRYLVEKGVKPDTIKSAGYGKYNPVASNGTAAGRAQNRRIEIELVPYDIRAKFK